MKIEYKVFITLFFLVLSVPFFFFSWALIKLEYDEFIIYGNIERAKIINIRIESGSSSGEYGDDYIYEIKILKNIQLAEKKYSFSINDSNSVFRNKKDDEFMLTAKVNDTVEVKILSSHQAKILKWKGLVLNDNIDYTGKFWRWILILVLLIIGVFLHYKIYKTMKKILVIIILISSYDFKVSAQEQQIDCATTILINNSVRNFKVYKYAKDFKALKLHKFGAVKNQSPEELMSSVLSANNLEWYNYNREEKKEVTSQDFHHIKQAKEKDYYFELLYKVSFEANGNSYAVIKYYLYDKNKEPIGFAESMKKINDKWYTTSESQISQLLFFVGMVDTQYIEAIFNNKKSDNNALNVIVVQNRLNGRIDINGVLKELENELSDENREITSILDANRLFK